MTASGWRRELLGDLIEIHDSKRIPLSKKQRSGRQGPFPYYGAQGIIDYVDDYLFDGRYLLIPEDGENLNSRKLPVAFFAEGRFWVNNHAHIVTALPRKADDYFIKAWFDGNSIAPYITGAAQPKLSQSNLKIIEILVPPLKTQRKIAAILSAYDDLIENNLRRIQILEEMAQNLYREWFVKFRFPGHETMRMVDSPLGPIPRDWEVTTFGQVTTLIRRGISPQYDDDSASDVINQKCIRDFRLNLAPARKHRSPVPEDRYVNFGDVLVNSTGVGTLGRVAQVQDDLGDCTVDSHVTIVRPKDFINVDFFGLQAFGQQDHFERQGQGATGQTELSREAIGRTAFINPPQALQFEFGEVARPLRLLGFQLGRRNNVLRTARDLLLPKLISGELDVSDLDIAVPDDDVDPTPVVSETEADARDVAAGPTSDDDAHDETAPRSARMDEWETDEIMAAFRRAARGRGAMSRHELLKRVSVELGYQRCGPRIEEALRGHLRAAIRRRIIAADGDAVWLESPTMEAYSRDELIVTLCSVMRKDRDYDRGDVIGSVANHLGFVKLRDSVVAPIKSAINGAIRRGILDYSADMNRIWRLN